MEAFELLAACYVFFGGLLVQFVQGGVGVLLFVDGLAEVEGNVVHQEAIEKGREVRGCLKGWWCTYDLSFFLSQRIDWLVYMLIFSVHKTPSFFVLIFGISCKV